MATVLTEGLIKNSRQGSFPPRTPDLTYRPDIDGLRALAVLAVLGFHASSTLLPGGYIGVDIFFVISGFLITSIICRNLDGGRFTFADFYARRAKRIFPSLMIVLAATWALGWLVLLSDEYQQLGKHIAAGAGFISNFALWQESGYFDKAAEYKPLLHLWSLGIEEQFYLLWPPLIAWAWKRKANVLNVACAIVAISFAANVMLITLWQSSAGFYLPPTRFWELLVGSALGYAHLFKREELSRWARFANMQASLGLALLLASVVAFHDKMFFPGPWALLPTIGAALLVNAGPEAWINRRILSSRPLVFVGLISYPLYLWHWPLLSFAHILDSGSPSSTTIVAALFAAFFFSWATYRFVEKPVRGLPNRAALVLVTSLAVFVCLGVVTFFHAFHPRSERYGLDKIIAATGEHAFPGSHLKSVHTELGYHWEQGNGFHRVLFVGDSNMEQYYPRIDKILTEHPHATKRVLFVTQAGCAPIPYMKDIADRKCDSGLIDRSLALARDRSVDAVVVGAAWNGYAAFTDPEGETAFDALKTLIARYSGIGRRVYLILPIPRNEEFDPLHMVSRSVSNIGFQVVRSPIEREKVTQGLMPLVARLRSLAAATGATTIDPVDYLCSEINCRTADEEGLPVYKDSAHLRPSYVREHVTFLDPILFQTALTASSSF